jgi:hypothetical protein
MMGDEIELVARAFYEAEYPDSWDNAPESSQNQFRDLARIAIASLDSPPTEIHSSSEFMDTSCRNIKAAPFLSA